MASETPPTSELGHANPALIPWSAYHDVVEEVPAVQWPASLMTYGQMRSDSQIQACLDAFAVPVTRYQWMLDPDHADPAKAAILASDLGLPLLGHEDLVTPRLRNRNAFSFPQHIKTAMLALVYGHMHFELVAKVQPDGYAHLTKLAPRMPQTLTGIHATPEGDLDYITQMPNNRPQLSTPIPANRLAPYVYDQEGGNLTGRSILRSVYKNWLLKDSLIRIDAMKHERNGMGIPEYEAPKSATQAVINDLAQKAAQIRVGQYQGGASPNGAKLRLVGVEGSLPDTIASVRYHDEQIARRFLAMFLQLGTTASGSRALGDSFVDFFALAQESLADWFETIFNQHVVERMVDWNWGESEPAPKLIHVAQEGTAYSVDELERLVSAGLLIVDDELRAFIRSRGDLPEAETAAEPSAQQRVAMSRRALWLS